MARGPRQGREGRERGPRRGGEEGGETSDIVDKLVSINRVA